MRSLALLPLLLPLALFGCSKAPASTPGPTPTVETKSPEEKLHEQLSSGNFQLMAGLDSIEAALKEAKAAKVTDAAQKQSLADIQDAIDSAGSGLAEEDEDPPTKEQVAKDMKGFEAKRAKLCDLINDSLHDLRDARGIVDSLDGPLENVGIKIDAALDDLRGALEALGGKEELDEQ